MLKKLLRSKENTKPLLQTYPVFALLVRTVEL